MAPETDPVEFLGRKPDERLLGDELGQLPAALGEPEPLHVSPGRRQLVAVGATLTGVTLIGGVILVVLGLVEAIAGGSTVLIAAALAVGIILVATHWGWVHVAELGANRLELRRNAPAQERRRSWLTELEPYSRWEVSTATEEDGSIAIVTTCHHPVTREPDRFSFVRQEVAREVHSADEPAAAVTERAELLRRRAAAQTEGERKRFAAARDAYDRVLIAQDDEQQRRAALRAASQALSERINSNLRDPPLTE